MRVFKDKFLAPFHVSDKLHYSLLFVFVLINVIVLVNAILHPPIIGYDAHDHLKYIVALSKGHLVTPKDSREFFSPPLPLYLPSNTDEIIVIGYYAVCQIGSVV